MDLGGSFFGGGGGGRRTGGSTAGGEGKRRGFDTDWIVIRSSSLCVDGPPDAGVFGMFTVVTGAKGEGKAKPRLRP